MSLTPQPMTYHQARTYAREMRKNPTPAENALWEQFRNRRFQKLKVNRQYIVEYLDSAQQKHYFIPDFYCHEYRLIIEVDGPVHDFQQEEDSIREARLKLLGFRIIRFQNHEVLENIEKVLNRLRVFIEELDV